jgi:hypothetical protein
MLVPVCITACLKATESAFGIVSGGLNVINGLELWKK